MADYVSKDINDWWFDDLSEQQRRDYLSAMDALEQGDTIVLKGHICTREDDGLRLEEH
jgi:hypothetical protein